MIDSLYNLVKQAYCFCDEREGRCFMTYIRKIASGQSVSSIIDIPEKWKGKNVEILVFPIEEKKTFAAKKQSPVKSLRGALQAYGNPRKIQMESAAWGEATEAKHGHC
jgi:hypothetical protein